MGLLSISRAALATRSSSSLRAFLAEGCSAIAMGEPSVFTGAAAPTGGRAGGGGMGGGGGDDMLVFGCLLSERIFQLKKMKNELI